MGILGVIIGTFIFTLLLTVEPIRDFLFGDLDELDENSPGRNATLRKRGGLENIPVVYGTRRVGGILNFKGSSAAFGKENIHLFVELIFSEGECESVEKIYLDGEEFAFVEDTMVDFVKVTTYPGTDSHAAHPELVNAFSDYTSSDKALGLCKAVFRFQHNREDMNSEPKVEALIKGKKIYDPRTTTTVYSTNPALVLYDYLTNTRYGAGYKILASDLVVQDFIDAADYCDTQIQLNDGTGTTTDYYQINAVIDTGKTVLKNIKEILNSFHAHLVRDGDKYRLIVEKDETSALSLNSDNIVEDSITYAINDVKDRYNEIVVDYPNEENNYLDDQKIVQDATLLSNDNGIESQKRIKNYLDVNQYRMEHFAKIVLKKSRQGIAVGLTANEEAFEVLPGAVVDVTLSEPGWSAKKFRVLKVKELQGGNIAINLLEHESTVYNRSVPVAAPTPPDTYLPDPFTVDQVIGTAANSGIAHVITNSAGDLVARILLTWTALTDVFITHYEVRARINGASEWIYQSPAIGQESDRQYIVGFKDGDTVDMEVRAINARGVAGAWSSTLSHTVEGALDDPPDVDVFNIIMNPDGTRVANFRINTPPIDLSGYKIKYSSDQSATWVEMDELHEGLLPVSPFEFNLLSEGDYRFGIKAYDRGGRESENPTYVIAELSARRLGSILRTDNPRGQGWPGTLTDCRVEASDNSLVAATTTTWADLTDTWADYSTWLFDTETSFTYEYQTIDLGASLRIAIDVQGTYSEKSTVTIEESHSDDNITYTSFAGVVGFITARYIKIKITVTNTVNVPKVENMNIYIGGDSIVDIFTLLDTSALTDVSGGVRIPIRSSFNAITDVNVSLHSVGAGATWEILDLDATNGPHIKMYDSGGLTIKPTISAQVIGV